MKQSHEIPALPRSDRVPLTALGCLMALSVILVFTARFTGTETASAALPIFAESRNVIFSDTAGGSVAVIDADTGEEIIVYGTGEGGFTRTALRALAYSRRLHEIGADEPFIVGRGVKGQILLHDPTTEKTVGIDAFGDVNAQQFARLLVRPEVVR